MGYVTLNCLEQRCLLMIVVARRALALLLPPCPVGLAAQLSPALFHRHSRCRPLWGGRLLN